MLKKVQIQVLIIFLVMGIVFQSNSVWAQENPEINKDKKYDQRSSNETGRSEMNRKNKKFAITAQPAGIGPTGGFSNALTFGLFLEPNAVLEFEYLKANNYFFFGDILGSLKAETKNLGVYYKQFAGNSFYGRLGGNYRWVDYAYSSSTWLSGDSSEKYSFKGSALVASAGIGNQWHFEGFTLGCDWVGIEIPLASQFSDESYSGTYGTESEFNDRKTRYVKDISLNLVHFYLGASF